MRSLKARLIIISLLSVIGLYWVSPSIIYFTTPKEIRNDEEQFLKRLPSWLPQKHVKLGLDLQGGVQLVLGVSTLEAVVTKLNNVSVEVKRWSDNDDKKVEKSYVLKESQILRVELQEGADPDAFKSEFKSEFPGFNLENRDGNIIDYSYSEDEIDSIRSSAVEQAERVVRSRVDKWGVSEPIINRRQDNSILVQLPGFKDPQKAKELLGRTAQLQFKLVDDEFTGFDSIASKLPKGVTTSRINKQLSLTSENKEQLEALLKDLVPEDKELLFERNVLPGANNKARFQSYVLHAPVEMTGEDILNANVGMGGNIDPFPAVNIRFTGKGAKLFGDLTSKNIGRYLAMVLDNEVISAPYLKTKILDGRAMIELGGVGRSYQEVESEANELALILRSGSLPAKITVLEERQVGASLGPELANQGMLGTIIGIFLVILSMMVLYRKPGFIACLSIIFGGIWLMALMGLFGFALTLPGIAGFVLILGMAVDANVLINERIRQEARSGRNAKKAVEVAFQKVFYTIIDANITTLIAALVLLQMNPAGPIRGFALTLILGIIVTLFISLYVSKALFEGFVSRCKSDAQVRSWLGGKAIENPREFSINFIGLGKGISFGAIALAVIILGVSVFKGLNWGVDFAGGTEIHLGFDKPVNSTEIRKVASDSGIKNVTIQSLQNDNKEYLMRFDRESGSADGSAFENKLQEEALNAENSQKVQNLQKAILTDLSSYSPEILQADFVGPQVGHELRNQGFFSVLVSVLFIIGYIALRFDMRFGPGAVIKMILDIFLMLGLYVFFWRTFDLTSVAAFLTVVGYSVNDTIVIYDRIRENLMVKARRTLKENINISINETLTRTINTSLTTILALAGIIAMARGQIRDFAVAIVVGVIVATLSSAFVASSFILWAEKFRGNKKASPSKRGQSGRPAQA